MAVKRIASYLQNLAVLQRPTESCGW